MTLCSYNYMERNLIDTSKVQNTSFVHLTCDSLAEHLMNRENENNKCYNVHFISECKCCLFTMSCSIGVIDNAKSVLKNMNGKVMN